MKLSIRNAGLVIGAVGLYAAFIRLIGGLFNEQAPYMAAPETCPYKGKPPVTGINFGYYRLRRNPAPGGQVILRQHCSFCGFENAVVLTDGQLDGYPFREEMLVHP